MLGKNFYRVISGNVSLGWYEAKTPIDALEQAIRDVGYPSMLDAAELEGVTLFDLMNRFKIVRIERDAADSYARDAGYADFAALCGTEGKESK